MKKITILLALFAIATSSLFAQFQFSKKLLFVAKLEGDQEVPPLLTTAVGEASFSLNASRDTLCINLTVNGLSGPMTGAHIHEGPVGGIGSVVVDLTGFIIGSRVSAVITAPQLTPEFISKMMGNAYYINVHTAAHPNGEIRGQIGLEADIPFTASLDGAQETPAVSTNATGLAVFDLSRNMISMRITGYFQNLSGPITGIHLHSGAPGVAGSVVADLMSGLNQNKLDITVDPSAYGIDLMNGNIYLNVHTSAHPNGEIRGQVNKQLSMSFDAYLDGTQEVPAVSTNAKATGMMTFSPAMDTIWYDFLASGLSGAITSAHFHTGVAGVAGPVAINLGPGINGNRVKGMITGSNIPAGFMDDCLTGKVYVNIHTTAHSGGEIRGQLMRYVREGYTYIIDATQETPPTASSGIGSGIASVDRDIDNLHFRMIVDGLSGPITSAHFHEAQTGVAGPVIFDLTPYFSLSGTSDVAFNYWMSSAGFDQSMAALFFANRVYVNIHTAAFANGEVRGQVTSGGNCSNTSTGIHALTPLLMDINLYPNPLTGDVLTASFDALTSGNGQATIFDISGRKVGQEDIRVSSGRNIYNFKASLQPGLYMLRFELNEQQQFISSFVKN